MTPDLLPSEKAVSTIKDFRKSIDAQIVIAEQLMGFDKTREATNHEAEIRKAGARELTLVRTKLQEAKMWAGKILEVLGNPFPAELADKATGNNLPGGAIPNN
jgi:hypothetical protein